MLSGPGDPFSEREFQTIAAELQSIHGGIGAILRDEAGDLWLAGEGLYRWRGSTLKDYREVNGEPMGQTRELLEDVGGGLWIASDDGLLFLKDDHFTVWKEPDGLSSNHVVALHKDKDGVLWISTADGAGLTVASATRFLYLSCNCRYRTWWFVGVVVVLVCGALVFGWKFRVSQLHLAYAA